MMINNTYNPFNKINLSFVPDSPEVEEVFQSLLSPSSKLSPKHSLKGPEELGNDAFCTSP